MKATWRTRRIVTKPTVHLNGTSREALLDGYTEACSALQGAIKALEGASPNARDYYPVPGSFEMAHAEHADRLKRLQSVLQELGDLVCHVDR